MMCPECSYPQHCPCSNCRDRLPEGVEPWVCTYPEGDMVQCVNCGWWWGLDEEWALMEDRLSDPAYYATMNYGKGGEDG